MKSIRMISVAVAALMGAMPAGAALAQARPDLGGTPFYGSTNLSAGFTPDPHEVRVLPGGDVDVSNLGAACVGYVGTAPDYQVNYEAGSLGLNFSVDGPIDTALVINGPDGNWTCDDDSAGNLDPLVRFSNPQSGRYDVWVASLSKGVAEGGEQVRLLVSELDRDDASTDSTNYPDLTLSPIFGSVNLSAGFVPDPHRVRINSGGTIPASNVSDNCMGSIGVAPDYQVFYEAGRERLTFKVTGKIDSTLLISTPNGNWVCDDDSGGNENPRLSFKAPQSGRYDIWVGDFRGNDSSQSNEVTLEVTETD